MIHDPRFLLYSHDSYGLGHLRRNLALARGLVGAIPGASVVIVTGSPNAHSFELPPRTRCVPLPGVTKDAAGRYVPRERGRTLKRVLAERTEIINTAVQDFEPDLILIDHSPLGLGGELREVLGQARAAQPLRPIVLGLRDIYDDPNQTRRAWKNNGIGEALERAYDQVLVYGQRSVFSAVQEYGLPEAVEAKTVYTGYVNGRERAVDPAGVRARFGRPDQPLVLVTVGGGGDGDSLVNAYLQGLQGRAPEWRSLVVTGPMMSAAGKAAARAAAAELPSAEVLEFTPRMVDCMTAADLVVSMTGYNSTVELLARRKRVITVPRVFPRREQLVRAERLQALGLLRMIHPGALRPAGLVDAVAQDLSRPPARPDLDLGGVDGAVTALRRLLPSRRRVRGRRALVRASAPVA